MTTRILSRARNLLFEGEVLRLISLASITKPIGLLSQVLMAKYYGAGAHYDAYVLSFFLVNFLANTIGGVFTAVVLPYLTRLKSTMDRTELQAVVNAVVLLFLLPLLLFAFVLVFDGRFVVNLAAPNAAMETKDLAVRMLKWMAVPGILIAVVEILKSVLNANRAFRLPTMLPIVNSLVMLLVLIVSHNQLGIWSLPAAFCISYSVQSAIIIFYGLHRRIINAVRPNVARPFLREILGLSWIVFVSMAILFINNFVDKVFASGLEEGSISSIAYATTLLNFATQIFQISLVTVMFTKMSEYIGSGEIGSCNVYLEVNIRRLVRLAVPAALAVCVASTELVQVLFQRDAFSAADTARTSSALGMYILGAPAILVNFIIARVFHSLKKLKIKMVLEFQYLATNVAGNFLLVGAFKVMGLALASTIAINVHLLLSIILLARYRNGLVIGPVSGTIVSHYILGFLTWLAYYATGTGALISSLFPAPTMWEAVVLGTLRVAFVFLVFGLLLVAKKFLWDGRVSRRFAG